MTLPNVDEAQFQSPEAAQFARQCSSHKPRFLLLYGSLRNRSFSRLVVEECARLLTRMGGEVRIFNPDGLPLPDSEDENHPKVQELRELVIWSEGQV